MFYSFCLSKMGKRYATRQKTRESAVMSGETENREDILPYSLAFGSHGMPRDVFRRCPFQCCPSFISAVKTRAPERCRRHFVSGTDFAIPFLQGARREI